MPIKICAIEPSGLEYGSELTLLDILRWLDRSKFASEVILPKGSPFKERLACFNIPILEFLYMDYFQGRNVKRPISYLRIMFHLIINKPDVIIVNQSGILRGIAFCNFLLNLPIITFVSTLADAKHVSNLPKWVFKNVYRLVCNSEFIACVTHNSKINQDKIQCVYHYYFNKDLFSRRPPWDPNNTRDKFVIGILGRICKSKGHDLLVNTLIALEKNQFPWIKQLEVRFIGDYQQQKQEEMIQLITQAPVPVVVTGYIREIGAEIAKLHLLVIPSIAEAFGRIVQEAAEAGLPVIASDSGGLGEVCRKYNYGILFKYPDIYELAKLIGQVMKNYDNVLSDSLRQRKSFLAEFSDDKTIKKIEKIFIDAVDYHEVN